MILVLPTLLLLLSFNEYSYAEPSAEETRAIKWLEWYNSTAERIYYADTVAQWNYKTNVTDYNNLKLAQASAQMKLWSQEQAQTAKTFDFTQIKDLTVSRLLESIATVGIRLPEAENILISTTIGNMTAIYNSNPICAWKDGQKDCSTFWDLDPDLYRVISESRDYDELLYAWEGWREATKSVKFYYPKYVQLQNKGARADGFEDAGDYWRSSYDTPDLQDQIEAILHQVLPFYEQVHTYVRRNLKKQYPGRFDDWLTLPAHILGNMWSQEWQGIYDISIPFGGKTNIDVTQAMREQKYDALRMFHTADDFFASLGLIPMPQSFWNGSMFVKPTDRRVVCHASAWDFHDRKDFRIKMCTSVTMDDLVTIHHEMGHVEYYLQYAVQPLTFRSGANPGFHEAIGDSIALSVSAPEHLKKIGLLPDYEPDYEQDINYLYKQALEKVQFLPFAYLMDLWRWRVFDGSYTEEKWNKEWWKLRFEKQGISPPRERPEDAFDPAAKSHIDSNTPYIRYFVKGIVQFQFYKALCQEAGFQGPLHRCDFFNNKSVGKKFASMLQMGSSKPWPDAMEQLTGQRKMDASALLEYFQPVYDWLIDENKKADDCFGWGSDSNWPEDVLATLPSPRCKSVEQEAKEWLNWYNTTGEQFHYRDILAEWTYKTNVTDYNNEKLAKESTRMKLWLQKQAQKAKSFNLEQISDPTTKRLLKSVSKVGIKLSEEDSIKLSTTVGQMTAIYNTNPVCSWQDGRKNCDIKWDLDPDLDRVLSESRDYDELQYVWEAWRNATKTAQKYYPTYVELQNKGAKADGFEDSGDYWRSSYEIPDLQAQVERLLHEILPLYEQIHTYVRRKLLDKYPGRFDTSAIPAHILGDMWAQSWQNIFDFTQPFSGKSSIDVTQEMRNQKYDAKKMFHTADDFFASLGLVPMPQAFWNGSMFVKPTDRVVVCHASAWDFRNRHDYRIKMCTSVTMNDLITIHHEMGHVQYYLNYFIQPVSFRRGANPGFHEAIGDTIALSVSTPQHLEKIGLLKDYVYDEEQDLNFLFRQALERIMFIPFAYAVDLWRWQVFDGSCPRENWNNCWWEHRFRLQGIVPPRARPSDAFDPGSKSHVDDNTPYIRYFVAYIVQFQFYEAMCKVAGHQGPVHQCDFYNNKAAGAALAEMLKMGSSKPWPDALEKLTGKREMDASSILNYFKPIHEWLAKQNQEANECYGWGADDFIPAEVLEKLPQPRCGAKYKRPEHNHGDELKKWLKGQAREACLECKFCQQLCEKRGIACCDF